jgi:cupin 2 domain-containing protein
MKASNIFNNIADNLDEELFEDVLKNKKINIQRIVSQGHKSPESGWYDQDEDEWVIVLQGEAVVSFVDESETRLKEGDYINIPAHVKHKVSYTSNSVQTVWLAIHYN